MFVCLVEGSGCLPGGLAGWSSMNLARPFFCDSDATPDEDATAESTADDVAAVPTQLSRIREASTRGIALRCGRRSCSALALTPTAQIRWPKLRHTAKLERDKIHKHASKAEELGMQFMPIAFTTYGGMGDEFLKKRWRPFFKELMAEELKAGGKGWKTRKRQQRALEKLSIVLARENGAMIARATSWQQAVATRP